MMINRRRVYGGKMMINTYTPLEYIQSNGECYIETGVLNKDVAIEMRIVTQYDTSNDCLWCSREDYKKDSFSATLMAYNNMNIRVDIGDTYYSISSWTKDAKEMVIGYSNGEVKVNGSTVLTVSPKKFTNYNYITLLDTRLRNEPPTLSPDNNANYWLKGCKIWQGSTLVRDFVPVLKLRTEAGLLDRVSGDFYTSPNGAKFKYKL